MITLINARWNARSVPGRMGSHSVALAAVLVKRGSRYTTLAPRSIAWLKVGSLRGGDGFHQVAPGQDDVFEVVVFAGRFFHAVGHQVRDDHGIEAQAALRAVVRRAVGIQQVLELDLAQVVRGREDHRLRAVLLLDVQHVLGHQVQCFLPGGLAEQPFAALAHPDERRQHPVGIVGVHQAGLAARAQFARWNADGRGCLPA